jgi:hypothetical protein
VTEFFDLDEPVLMESSARTMNLEEIRNMQLSFILAMPRTGSTLLSSMLNAHPDIVSIIEESFAYYLYSKYGTITTWTSQLIEEYCYDFYLFSDGKLEVQFGTKQDLVMMLEKFRPQLDFNLVVRLTYLCFFPNKDKQHIKAVVDKHLNFHNCLGDVASFYPESKFIILCRDPRDSALTRWKWFGKKKLPQKQNYYYLALAWKDVYKKLYSYREKIGHHRFLEVKYEDLVTSPEPELKKICAFLGVPYNSSMLEYDTIVKQRIEQDKNNFGPAILERIDRHTGLTEKISTSKVGYWKNELTAHQANLVWTICGELAEKIGYDRHADFKKTSPAREEWFKALPRKRSMMVTASYYKAPFFIKYLIKKIRYGKNFNTRELTGKEFYERSYYGKK